MACDNGNNQVPEDVTKEILSRLTVKSLLRFKCVCRHWYFLMKNSSFITKHHNTTTNSRLIIQHHHYNNLNRAIPILSELIFSSMPPVCYNFDELEMPNNPEYVIGPLNGIFCLYGRDEDRIFLWNPAIRELKPVLVLPPKLPPRVDRVYHFFGFGLDIISNNLKVVWLRQFYNEEIQNIYNDTSVALYNLSTDSWKLFEIHLDAISSIIESLSNTYMNGVYYWMTTENFYNFKILSFDMHNENFQELPGPPDITESQFGFLATYNGSIVMILYYPQEVEKYFEIWAMEEKGFWIKQLTVGPVLDNLCPVGIRDNGDLFGTINTSRLVLYNNHATEINNLGHYNSSKVFIYKESLVSVKGRKECKERNTMVQA
ncbi:putative F-box protein At1g32420 [Cornus florida]|uniref:putative F-box protein At1g32420 n=1 Tax=Cornus florida TaxID=4283 RepID=UPI00289FE081|nr:putative F-box protein At1g32420 [Cornus florida]